MDPHKHHVRHRRFQLIITSGVTISTLIAVLWPELSHASVIVGTVANFIWIWEE